MSKIAKVLSALALLSASVSVFAANTNFTCPQPSEIQSTNFSVPSVWIAPPMPHSTPDVVGVGLGGDKAKQLLGVEPYTGNGRPGWVCVYESKGGTSFNEYRSKLIKIANSNHYLKKYLADITRQFDQAEPFLKNYSTEKPLGFIGYEERSYQNDRR